MFLLTKIGGVLVLGAIAYGSIGMVVYSNAGLKVSGGRLFALFVFGVIACCAVTWGLYLLVR